MDRDLPDGCYLGLDFAQYIAQRGRLGSSEKGTLALHGAGFFWKYLSPFRKAEAQTDDQAFGEQLHAILLEGMHAYESRYVVKPEKADHPEALFTIDQIKVALREEHVHLPSSETKGYTKSDWAAEAEIHLPDKVVWDNLMEEFERRSVIKDGEGRIIGRRKGVSAEDDYAIRAMHDIATNPETSTPDMRELMGVGSEFPILAEVSVLWTCSRGLKHRARFDKMIPVATGDLKSLGAWQGRPPVHAVDEHIKRFGLDVQLSDYQLARLAAFQMIRDDPSCIHGGTAEQRLHLQAMAKWSVDKKPAWLWIFFQKPAPSGRAPILFPLREEWGGPYHLSGFRKRHKALDLYQDFMARFGPDKPWGTVEPVHFTSEAYEPHITVSHYGFEPDTVPGEEDFLLGRLS